MNNLDCNCGIGLGRSKKDSFFNALALRNYYTKINSFIDKYSQGNQRVLDIGCGGGDTLLAMRKHFPNKRFEALDISFKMINSSSKLNHVLHIQGSVYELPLKNNSYSMVICTEVLEHLCNPEKALNELNRVTSKYCILGVPNEPLFSMANLLRLRHIKNFGSTPGHIQNWNRRQFIDLVNKHFKILDYKICCFVWTILMCEKYQKE